MVKANTKDVSRLMQGMHNPRGKVGLKKKISEHLISSTYSSVSRSTTQGTSHSVFLKFSASVWASVFVSVLTILKQSVLLWPFRTNRCISMAISLPFVLVCSLSNDWAAIPHCKLILKCPSVSKAFHHMTYHSAVLGGEGEPKASSIELTDL